MDADISAATTALDLDKIKAQDYRASIASAAADRAAYRAIVQGFVDWAKAEYSKLPVEETAAAAMRRQLAVAIAVNYMKPSTATLDDSILADAALDGKKLRAALDAASAAAG